MNTSKQPSPPPSPQDQVKQPSPQAVAILAKMMANKAQREKAGKCNRRADDHDPNTSR
jgi:hypothetical protein